MQIKFKWTEEISVNNIIIDNQHKELLNQINKLIEVILQNKPEEVVSETVSFLDNYIQGHLKYEEKYMQENMYPEFKSHKEKHGKFIESYNIFKEELKLTGPSEKLLLNIETHLGQWWIQHIGKEDRLYAEFISNN